MPPFGQRLTAPAVCVRLCVRVCAWASISSPIHTLPSLLASALHVPYWVRQKQTELCDLCIHTYQPPAHHIHTHQHHPRALFQTCIWHMKTRHTHISEYKTWHTNAPSHRYAHSNKSTNTVFGTLSPSSHEHVDISTRLQKWKRLEKKKWEHACMHAYPSRRSELTTLSLLSHAGCVKLPAWNFDSFKAILNNSVQISVQISHPHSVCDLLQSLGTTLPKHTLLPWPGPVHFIDKRELPSFKQWFLLKKLNKKKLKQKHWHLLKDTNTGSML